MRNILEDLRFFIGTHKVASIAVASILGVAAISGGAYAAYSAFTAEKQQEDVVIEVEVEEEAAAEDVYIPEFKSIVLTSESLEKDLTIYISDQEDNALTGVPFQVKLVTPEKAEELKSYVDAIDDLNAQITEMTVEGTSATEALKNRNVDIEVTDENGQVVDSEKGDIKGDPLYQLYLDKETAIQSFAMALRDAEGTVYTDDDEDGVIAEKDMTPGDYVACLLNDFDQEMIYEPQSYTTAVNVKDKVEYKVQKEITKQIKKDVAAEDGQKKEAVPVEETLKDTVEYVDSRKVENGNSVKETKDVVAPKATNAATATKAEVKDKGITTVSHKVKQEEKATDDKNKETDKDKDKDKETKPDTNDQSGNSNTGDNTSTDNTSGDKDKEKDKDQSDDQSKEKTDGTDSDTSSDSKSDNKTTEENKPSDDKTEEETTTEKVEELKQDSGTMLRGNVAVSFKTPNALLGAKVRKVAAADDETAKLDMSYKDGAFTISATTNVTDVKVNGTAVTMNSGKGTYKVSGDGDFKLTGTPKWSDKVAATDKEKLYITYTVSGFGGSGTERLKDKAGNELFTDKECKTAATAKDYASGKTFYYKAATYTYYGWQTIDGNTYFFDKNGNKVTGTQVIQGVQYDFGADGVLVVKGTGIDVSKYQGNIDWKAAKAAVNFAIVRCGYRGMYDGQLHEDPYFYKNMSGAKAAGVNVGVYIYSTALNEAEAVQEASMAVAMAGKAGGCSYPIFLDMEDTVRGQSKLSTEQRMAIVNAFVSTVQSSGYRAGFYCSKNWMTARMNAAGIPSSCSIWIAQYNKECTYSGRKNIWQYSSKGSVPGIKGNVDMNKSF